MDLGRVFATRDARPYQSTVMGKALHGTKSDLRRSRRIDNDIRLANLLGQLLQARLGSRNVGRFHPFDNRTL